MDGTNNPSLLPWGPAMTNTRSFVTWDVTAFLILCAALAAIHGANVFVTLAPLGLGWDW